MLQVLYLTLFREMTQFLTKKWFNWSIAISVHVEWLMSLVLASKLQESAISSPQTVINPEKHLFHSFFNLGKHCINFRFNTEYNSKDSIWNNQFEL